MHAILLAVTGSVGMFTGLDLLLHPTLWGYVAIICGLFLFSVGVLDDYFTNDRS